MKIRDHFEKIEKELNSCPLIISVQFRTEVIDLNNGYYKAKAKFLDGSELHLFEYIESEKELMVEKYRYHYQNQEGKTVIRWDNAKHHKEIDTFPDHVHKGEEVKQSERPKITEVLRKVIDYIENMS